MATPLRTISKKERSKDRRLRTIYNSSLEEFNQKMKDQGNACEICQRPFPEFQAFQDHFHGCCPRRLKKFCGRCNRGLLCFICNKFVMGVIERTNIPVERVLAYMQKWEPILRQKGAYEPKEKSPRVRRKKKSV